MGYNMANKQMKKILLMLAFILTAGVIIAANPPQLSGKTFLHGETSFSFSSSNKVQYLCGDDRNVDEMIERQGTYSVQEMGFKTKTSTSHGSIYRWKVTINVQMSYGSKTLTGWLDVYEDGVIVGGEMNIDGKIYNS